MKYIRSYIILASQNGSGKIYNILMSHHLLGFFLFLIFLCICSVPLLETKLMSGNKKISYLKHENLRLEAELAELKYLKITLSDIETRDKLLREYFGIDEYEQLETVVGRGVSYIDSSDPNVLEKIDEKYSSHTYSSITLPVKLQALESNIKILKQLSVLKEKMWEYTPSIIPVEMENPRITSKFGWRKNPLTKRDEFHAGIDILGSKWVKIVSPAAGVVINRGYDQWLGNYIVVQHTKDIKTIYGHMHKISAANGAEVSRGDFLGHMGNTGMSTGIHLHYSVINEGQPVDPMEYILDIREG